MSPLTVRIAAPDGPVQVNVWPAADDHADAAAPVLLAFHGWTDSGEVFGTLAETLGRRWTVVAPDAPGHGGTPLRDGDYVVAAHVAPAAAVLDALPRVVGRGRPVVALGHSMGALTATRLAAARPGSVAALVLEDPARTTLRRPGSPARMRAWLRGLNDGDHRGRTDWARANHPDWPEAELDAWARSKAMVDVAHLDRTIDWGEPLPVLLAEVTCPVLLVHGEPARGGIVSPTAARRCAAACRGGAQILPLPAGHCPRREASAAFARALARVLTRVAADQA